jgi:enhancer of polycomb-like protein
MSTNPDNDPYVCFRIREVKIHRKVRRSDTLAQDKLRRLRNDMVTVSQLLDLLAGREKARKEVLEINCLIFEKRMQVRRLKKFLGVTTADTLDASPEKSARKKHRLEYVALLLFMLDLI